MSTIRPAGAHLRISWHADKTLSGLSIQYTEQVIDDNGLAVQVIDGPAIPIGSAEGAMLLQDALDQTTDAALQAADVEQSMRLAAESERDTERAAKEAAQAERDQRAAERDTLQAEVDALRGRSAFHVRKSVILRRMTPTERRNWRQGVRRAETSNNPSTADLTAEDAMMIFANVGPALDTSDPDARSFGLALVSAGVLSAESRVDELLQPE